MRKLLGAVALLALLAVQGCAMVPATTALSYEPQTDVSALPLAGDIAVQLAVSDTRKNQRRVSNKRHGWGFNTASIYTDEPIEATVATALKTELENRGYRITEGQANVVVRGEIDTFYSRVKFGLIKGKTVGDFSMELTVLSSAGETLYRRQIANQPEHTGILYQSAGNLVRPLELAIEEGLQTLFDDPAFLAALNDPRAL